MRVDRVLIPTPEIPRPAPEAVIGDAVAELLCIADALVVLGERETRDDGSVPGAWMAWLGNCVFTATEELQSALRALDKTANPV